jgi:hypothetical protein
MALTKLRTSSTLTMPERCASMAAKRSSPKLAMNLCSMHARQQTTTKHNFICGSSSSIRIQLPGMVTTATPVLGEQGQQ